MNLVLLQLPKHEQQPIMHLLKYCIPGYQSVFKNRESGRVALYIQEQLFYSLLSDRHVSDINFSFELLFFEKNKRC